LVLEDVSQDFFRHATFGGLAANTITESLQLLDIVSAHPLVPFRRNDHGNITVLTADDDGFALGCIKEGGEALFGVGGGDDLHLSILDKMDKIGNISVMSDLLPGFAPAGQPGAAVPPWLMGESGRSYGRTH
jgi:hypothetical protein